MNSYTAFLEGIKPGFLAVNRYHEEEVNHLIKLGYPHYNLDHNGGGSTFFFQNEDQKSKFISEFQPEEKESILIVGKYLGYPAVACEFFLEANENKVLNSKRAGFNYHGIAFAGNIDDAELIAEWLWENVQAPLVPVTVEYQGENHIIKPLSHVTA